MKKAEEFFGKTYKGYTCDSWLLSPVLKQFLSEDSNIIKFHYDFPQAEQRIFEDVRDDKENHPEDTVLRRKAKPFYVAGNDIGVGFGIIER